MVDAVAPVGEMRSALAATTRRAPTSSIPTWVVSHGDGEAFAAYRKIAAEAIVSPSQSSDWVSAWLKASRPDAVIAMARISGQPVMGIALEIVRKGPFRIARFMGGTHACGNFAPIVERFSAADLASAVAALRKAVADARPDVDMLSLERLAADLRGVRNPLLGLPHLPSPNVALAVSLAGGFDQLLLRASGKRKKKKHRSQTRKFEAAGPHRRFQAATPPEVDRVLDAFLAMKEQRFRQKGIDNVFEPAEVRAFFRMLFTEGLTAPTPPFQLHALEVAGIIRAVTGSSIDGTRLVCEFGAIADDELAHASPGEFLFFDNIREACERGFDVYDFSVGDEPYKRLWCDIETRQFDAYVPLTARGQILSALLRAENRAKSFVKNSPVAWKVAKALRKRTAAPDDDE